MFVLLLAVPDCFPPTLSGTRLRQSTVGNSGRGRFIGTDFRTRKSPSTAAPHPSRVVDVGFLFCLFNAKTSRVFELLASLENRFLRHNAKITINRSAEDSGFFLVIFFRKQ